MSGTSGTDDADIISLTETATTSVAKMKYITLNVPRQISALPQVVEAADRHKLSSNAVNDVLAALIRDCGGDVDDFVLSKSTTLRMRRNVRLSQFESVRRSFKADIQGEFCTVHWDEKLLREGDDLSAKEHIAILASYGDNVKLLGTSTLDSGTGMNQANAIKGILEDWDIEQSCLAMCFDTTASNTGKFIGACIVLEALLGNPLLWTACRHHMYEIVLGRVAREIFGTSTGPKIELFDLLKKNWKNMDFEKETTHIVIGENVCYEDVCMAKIHLDGLLNSKETYLPRDDYEELLKLCLVYIEKGSVDNFSFRRPGAHHRARWMSSAIYALKMILLQSQLEIDGETLMRLQQFADFVACYYAPNWFRCPLPADASSLDLKFLKRLLVLGKSEGSMQNIAKVVVDTMRRHLWYLTEELVPFALCSDKLHKEEKQRFALKLSELVMKNLSEELAPQKPVFPNVTENTTLYDLLGYRSVLLFQRLKFTVEDLQFLRYPCDEWDKFPTYSRLRKVVKTLKVVNDVAERGVRCMEEYKDILTMDSEQRNLIMQCVENTRKRYPDFKKSTLSKVKR